jgi:hypothetical protein
VLGHLGCFAWLHFRSFFFSLSKMASGVPTITSTLQQRKEGGNGKNAYVPFCTALRSSPISSIKQLLCWDYQLQLGGICVISVTAVGMDASHHRAQKSAPSGKIGLSILLL